MPLGDKKKYTDKQKREAEYIEEGYEKRGMSKEEAEKRAWATVNKMCGGGAKGGSGTEKLKDSSPAKKNGKTQAKRSAAEQSVSVKKVVETRKEKKDDRSWFAKVFS